MDPEQDAAPGGVLVGEDVDPVIKGGDGDLPLLTQTADRAGSFQICFQDGEDKAKGIGSIGDEDIRDDGMRVSTGWTVVHRDGDFEFFPLPAIYGDDLCVFLFCFSMC